MVLRNVSEQYEKIESSIRQPKTNALKKKKLLIIIKNSLNTKDVPSNIWAPRQIQEYT